VLTLVFFAKPNKIAFAQNSCPPNPPWFDCSSTSVGLTPLNEMVAPETYTGQFYSQGTVFVGGLYGNYQNTPPAPHLNQALNKANLIQPLNGNGQPDPNGKIGLMSIGMSNTNQEFIPFINYVNADPDVSDAIVPVNAARGSVVAKDWATNDTHWTNYVLVNVNEAGLTKQQVQVIWLKLTEYPANFSDLKNYLDTIVYTKLPQHGFNNVKIIYFSSRIYAGYTLCDLNPEPYAYETAFAYQDIIREQIISNNYSASTPVLMWGPYLWADGTTVNSQTDLDWTCHQDLNNPQMDFQDDGTHPSQFGEEKVATELINFFKNDPTTQIWFTSSNSPTPTPSTSPTATPTSSPRIEGDANNDGIVNIQDYVILSNQFGTSGPEADFNRDNLVNVQDYIILSNNFGS